MALFPLDLKKEIVTLMMVDELQVYKELLLTQTIETVIGELKIGGGGGGQ